MNARTHLPHPPRAARGFTIVELLVVLGIIAIMLAIVSPMVPGLLRGDRFDANVNTLTGVLEEAREAATANNTYVWVAFTDAPANSQTGLWVVTFQSQDGTETPVNTGTSSAPSWATTLAIPQSNLLLHSKVVNLPGMAIDATVPITATSAAYTKLKAAQTLPTPFTTPFASSWTVSTMGATGMSATTPFTHAIEFTPNGEAHVPTWSSNIQMGFYPATGAVNNYLLVNLSRLTGRATMFRL